MLDSRMGCRPPYGRPTPEQRSDFDCPDPATRPASVEFQGVASHQPSQCVNAMATTEADPAGAPAHVPDLLAMPARQPKASGEAGQKHCEPAQSKYTPVPAESLSRVLEGLRRLS